MRKFKVLGLTGQSGGGKSTVAKLLSDMGCTIIDADKVAKSVTENNKFCRQCLQITFGNDIIKQDESLDRRLLAERAFLSRKNTQKLNDITHPFILNEVLAQIKSATAQTDKPIIYDAPVLFESNSDLFCDKTLSVLSPENLRIERIMKRDGISKEQARLRISAQHDDDFYIKKSDLVIYNENSVEHLKSKTALILASLEEV